MATVRSPKPTASAKYDAFVEEQLAKAQRRVRLLDVSSGLLLFAAATLAYALAVGLIDRKLDFTPFTRQVAFTAYAVAAAVFLAVGVVRPLLRRVNPYYAARAVEGVVPGAKNSVVNWLDLHGASPAGGHPFRGWANAPPRILGMPISNARSADVAPCG